MTLTLRAVDYDDRDEFPHFCIRGGLARTEPDENDNYGFWEGSDDAFPEFEDLKRLALAWNCHDDLVAACEWFVNLCHGVSKDGGGPDASEWEFAREAGESALAKAKP